MSEKKQEAGQNEANVKATPLVVWESNANRNEEAERTQSNVIPFQRRRAGEDLTQAESTVVEWQINTGDSRRVVTITQVSSGFGEVVGKAPVNGKVYCAA
jgi:hypothetical protein